MVLSKAVHGFILARSADNYSTSTVRLFRYHLAMLREFLGDVELETIAPHDLERFMAYLRNDYVPKRPQGKSGPFSQASLHNTWCALRSFFRWCGEELGLARPDLKLKHPLPDKPIIQAYTEEELRAILKAVDTGTAQTETRNTWDVAFHQALRNRAIILTLLDCGLRLGELLRLRVGDADLETGDVTVARYGTGKKTKGRVVHLGQTARKAIWRYLATRDQVFPDDPLWLSQAGRPLSPNAVHCALQDLGVRASQVLGRPVHVYPHRFRHTFAIQYLRNGGDVFTLQRQLGHASLEMVNRYLDLARTDSQDAHRRASPVDRWHL